MTDTNAPTNQQIAAAEGKKGSGKIVSGIVAGIMTTYIMNQASLHGVNFQLLGISSEFIKSAIDGCLIGVFVGLTPTHFAAAVTDAIVFVKTTWRQWCQAWNSN